MEKIITKCTNSVTAEGNLVEEMREISASIDESLLHKEGEIVEGNGQPIETKSSLNDSLLGMMSMALKNLILYLEIIVIKCTNSVTAEGNLVEEQEISASNEESLSPNVDEIVEGNGQPIETKSSLNDSLLGMMQIALMNLILYLEIPVINYKKS